MPPLRRLRPDVSLDALMAALDADGAVIVETLVTASTLSAIATEVEAYYAAADPTMRQLNPALDVFHAGVRHVTGAHRANHARSP